MPKNATATDEFTLIDDGNKKIFTMQETVRCQHIPTIRECRPASVEADGFTPLAHKILSRDGIKCIGEIKILKP